jgi:tetratricopeptide (TPR) repeat protein
VLASLHLLATMSTLAVAQRRQRPWLFVGWAWYVVTLVPVIGLVQVGLQSMADRYTYVPMTGLLILAFWLAAEAAGRSPLLARLVPAAAFAAVAALGVMAWRQAHVWRDGVTLWQHALAVTEDNFIAHDNLGVELDRLGRADEALAHYRETIRLRPGDTHGERNYAQAHFATGQRLYDQGQLAAALPFFQEGLRHDPDNALALTYTGSILAALGRHPEALAAYDAALRLRPDFDLVRKERDAVVAKLTNR